MALLIEFSFILRDQNTGETHVSLFVNQETVPNNCDGRAYLAGRVMDEIQRMIPVRYVSDALREPRQTEPTRPSRQIRPLGNGVDPLPAPPERLTASEIRTARDILRGEP